MSDAPEAEVLPPSLRLLKWLVIVLTLTMIGGVITVVGLIVTRMPQAFVSAAPGLPDTLALPAGSSAAAVTFGKGWIAVVTDQDHILIFGKDGTLRQDIAVTPIAAPPAGTSP
jgi:Flp pilus assembly protein protease CpaA